MARIHRWLAGSDGPGKHALPLGEFLHPVPMAALFVLGVNDHWLKGAELVPAAVTGKLSDFAGLLFFPLLCTAAANLALLGVARMSGWNIDFSLGRAKLVVACVTTAAVFCAVKLSGTAADQAAGALSGLGFRAGIVPDPTDLVALPVLLVAYLVGRREIARVPLGRIEVLERAWRRGNEQISATLEDVVQCGGSREATERLGEGLAEFFRAGDATEAQRALTELRE